MDALPRISRERLSSLILSTPTTSNNSASSFAVIDVRDDDHVGGHIHTSTHVPSSTLDHKIPELVRTLADKEIVVFHCSLSQQRGPSAAGRYLRQRKRLVVKKVEEGTGKGNGKGDKMSGEKRGNEGVDVEEIGSEGVMRREEDKEEELWEGREPEQQGEEVRAEGKIKGQEVYVLDGGFVKWQEK
ncbi:hypothetical protein MMC24_003309 [Lignoscripta atroalba]|nr:hypothetical protein [Lignoscripta atroalba]